MTADSPELPPVARLLEDGAWLQALARSVIADQATADDVAQDAAVIALTKPPREAGALRGWLRRVVRNLATDAHRSAARREALEAACAKRDADDDAADLAARWEIRRQVVDAVLALDEPYRATLLLRFFEGLELAEVASRQRVPIDTVKTRQRRAIDMLRARLAHLDDGEGRRGFAVLLVLARPGETAAPGNAAPLTATVLGGLAMSTFAKTLVAGVVLLALGGAWWALRGDSRGDGSRASGASSTTATADFATTGVARARRHADAEPAGPPVPTNLSSFADFDAERDLRGLVVDPDDHAVEGARVAALPFDLFRWTLAAMRGETPTVASPIAEARSAADGSFRLRLTPGAQTFVRVSAKGFADVELPRLQAGQAIRVVLDPPTTLRVRVQDAGGTAYVGALVLAQSTMQARDPSHWSRSSTTGADGVVSWDGLPRGRSAKVALDVSPGTGRAPTNSVCALEDREVNETVVTLPTGRAVEGRVLDAETNVGVANARIFVDPRRPVVATTQSDGRFRFEGWSVQSRWAGDPENRVAVMADGFAPTWADVPEAKETKEFTIALRRGFGVAGKVVGPDGRPVAGAQVLAIAKERSTNAQTLVDATTDDAGAFRLAWFSRDATTPLSIDAAGFAPTVVAFAPPPKGQTTLDLGAIVVAPGRTVRGRVVDETGAAISGMYVRVLDPNDEDAALAPFRTTNDDGRFVFAGVASGKRRVWAVGRAPDWAGTKVDVEVPTDADPAPMTVVCGVAPPKPPAKVTLGARVVDEDGQPVPNVKLGVGYASGGSAEFAKSGNGGTLDVACAQEPQYVCTYLEGDLAKRYLYQFVWLRPGATTASIVLKRAEPVSGTVVDADGKPLDQTFVQALIGSRQVGQGMTDVDGRFSFGVPLGATVNLEARPNQSKRRSPDIGERHDVTAGSTDVTIRVMPIAMDRTLDVTLVLPQGEVAGKCEIWANFHGLDQSRQIDLRMTFDAAGRAHYDGLPRGPVQLRAMVRLAADDEKTFTGVTPVHIDGDATSVRIVVPGFRFVRGRVIDDVGAPSAGAYLFTTAASNGSQAYADAQGTFALRVVADAAPPFVVTATKTPFDRKAPCGGWDLIEDGSDRELTIVVRPQPPR